MARENCSRCLRPSRTCICNLMQIVDNQIEIGILQHPDEVTQSKGTAIIAKLCLTSVQQWVGESLQELPGLVNWLKDEKQVFLLYPDIDSQAENYQKVTVEQLRKYPHETFKILIVDGTWRKTYKMMQLNEQLRALDRVVLEPIDKSTYQIRKQKDANSLSTIEAIYQLLVQLEKDPNRLDKFAPLLEAFENMQALQLSFRNPNKS